MHDAEPPVASDADAPRPARGRYWFSVAALSLAIVVVLGVMLGRRVRDAAPPVLYALPDFSLTDSHERPFSKATTAGQIWVADFIYTTCGSACPMLTSRMHGLQDKLLAREAKAGRELPLRLVSFTVDPENDSPAVLAEYAKRWHADPRLWLFVTGPLAEIDRAVVSGMKIPFEKRATTTTAFEVMHGEKFVLVDDKGRIRGYYDTDAGGLAQLDRALDNLLDERGP